MRGQTNKQEVKKPGAREPIENKGLKSGGIITAQKRVVVKGKHDSTQAVSKRLDKQSNPEIPFSYKSTDDLNVLTIIDTIRTGISFNTFEKIVGKTPFTLAEWANYLQLSERTIQRAQKEKKSFQPIQSERIVELDMLYEYGVEVFGDKDNFNVWLNSRSVALGGRMPKELLDTTFGMGMVKDELGRIEHGILA